MKGVKSIFLLILLAMLIVPWQLVCFSHPSGHNHHHEPGELSSCQQRRAILEDSYWPPMECYRIDIHGQQFVVPSSETKHICILTTINTHAPYTILNENTWPVTYSVVVLPDNNSDPPIQSNQHRGPPIILYS